MTASDSIAVIGMAGRFPGARDVRELWQNVRNGVEAVTFFTPQELERAGVDPEIARHPSFVPAGALLDGVDLFDAAFFGFNRREAELLDPQHRLFLECAVQALEDARHDPRRFDGATGVYCGSSLSRYLLFHLHEQLDQAGSVNNLLTLIGNEKDYLASLVAYKLDLRGPAVNVQTACSTSLVAVHLAAQSLLDRECDLALAGGVTIQLPQTNGYVHQPGGILSPDGHCRAFDADAAGCVFGSGAGVVVLKRLDDALADGDPIRAVIRGTAVNNDGSRKVGFTAPGVQGQAAVIANAMAMAGVDPESIGYVEAHGTGTAIGDPIEIAALTEAFQSSTRQTQFCAIGSLKTNIGHLESAAGVAGLIKTILALEAGELPASLHYRAPNPQIDFAASPFYVNTETRAWPKRDTPRRAGVSSFGIGGTNAHVVVEEAPPHEVRRAPLPSRPFERQRYWIEAPRHAPAVRDALLGRRIDSPLDQWQTILTADELLREHRVGGNVIVPGVRYLEMALAARPGAAIEEIAITRPLVVDGSQIVQTVIDGDSFRISSKNNDGTWTLHATGTFVDRQPAIPGDLLADVRARCNTSIDVTQFYEQLAARGLEYGPAFLRLTSLWRGDGESVGCIDASGAQTASLDAALHVLGAALPPLANDAARLPAAIGAVRIHQRPAGTIWSHARVVRGDGDSVRGNVRLFDAEGNVLVEFDDLVLRAPSEARKPWTEWLYEVQWEPKPLPEPAPVRGSAAIADEVRDTATRANLSAYDELRPALDELAREYIARAAPAFDDALPRFAQLVTRLRAMRAVSRGLDTAQKVQELLARFPESRPEIELLDRCGSALAAVVRGERDPLVLLHEGDTAATLYHQSPFAAALNRTAARAVEAALRDVPADRALRILEIGAGTGGTTAALLPLLAGRNIDYCYTDVAPMLLARAAERFAGQGSIEYTSLDIEQPASMQPFGNRRFDVVIAANVLHATRDLRATLANVRELALPGALLLLVEGTEPQPWLDLTFGLTAGWWRFADGRTYPLMDGDEWRAQLSASGFADAEVHSLGPQAVITATAHVLRNADIPPALHAIDECARLLDTVRNADGSERLVIVTRNAQAVAASDDIAIEQSALWGIANVIELERPELRPLRMDTDSDDAVAAELAANDGETRVAWRNGERFAARLVPAKPRPSAPYGIAADLQRIPLERTKPGAGEVEIETVASSINFKDVLHSMGIIPPTAPLGGECAGVITAVGEDVTDFAIGDAVVAVAPGSFGSHVIARARDVARKPERLTFAQAASMPIAFLTADEALRGVVAGDRVLIHAASGGVGLAAVQIARHAGAEVFATAGSETKRDALRALGVRHVAGSRTNDFQREMQNIDRAVGAVTGDLVRATLMTLRPGGIYVDIARHGAWTAEDVHALRPDVDYRRLALDEQMRDGAIDPQTRLAEILGTLEPPPLKCVPIASIAEAFDRMKSATHVGKLVVEHDTPRALRVRDDATYLITGGTGGLGLAVARRLIERGARHLVLVSRNAPDEAVLRKLGANVRHFIADVADDEAMRDVFETIVRELPPLRGVVHAAGTLDDAVIAQQDRTHLAAVFAAKVDGTRILDRLTRPLPLDFFVLFSSAGALLGSPGQANHAAANAWMDALAHARRRAGFPAVSIAWAAWSEIGSAADAAKVLAQRGIQPITEQYGLDAFESAIAENRTHIAVIPIRAADAFRHSFDAPTASPAPQTQRFTSAQRDIADEIRTAAPARRDELLRACIEPAAAKIVGAEHALDPARPLNELGLDSLLAVELRNQLAATLRMSLPATLLFDYPAIDDLVRYFARELSPEEPVAAKPEPIREIQVLDAPVRVDAQPRADRSVAEPIAVIGIGCRFPGGGDDPESFWQMLRDGVDAVTEVPRDRFDVDAHFGDGEDGTMVTRCGSFLRSVDGFDPAFFGIAPREADSMDPQQRLLLEVAWEALERAGQAPGRLAGSQTGVFVGFCNNDYFQLRIRGGRNDVDPYFSTGVAASVAAGRLSYVLGLNGPSLTIDTACSSSLVAVHSAVQSLRSGECRMALAGGVNLMLAPLSSIALSALKMLAPDGRCKTFDASADGFSRGEGCGIVVLKTLADALADRDPIVAVIRGSAVNQDGRSSGLTAPNGPAQEAVIRQALVTGGVAPARVTYVEAHGTGTSLGDPIEVHALRNVLQEDRPADRSLFVGSVKTNMGHLEAAAGIAGLIKLLLALQHRQIPPHLHLRELNPHIETGGMALVIPSQQTEWSSDGPRVGGVSSFGFSGTNAHVVVEEAPAIEAVHAAAERPLHVLPLSAKSDDALRDLVARMRMHLTTSDDSAADICYSAAAGRAHFAHRTIVSGATKDELTRALDAASFTTNAKKPKIAFLFSGQGSQHAGMARVLYETQPLFRAEVDRCHGILGYPVLRETGVDDTAVTQPLLFTVEWALAALWRSWGIEPSLVLGHSVGEYVAACVAGVMTVEEALPLIAARGRLMASLDGEGAMAAVLASDEVVQRAIDGLNVDVAVRNGRENIVLSGDREAVDAALRRLDEAGHRYERLRVSEAFHSRRLEPMLDSLRNAAEGVAYSRAAIPIVSNVTGGVIESIDAEYWVRHARGTVEFAHGMRTCESEGIDTYLEIGSGSTLLTMGRRAVDHAESTRWVASLRRGRDDWEQLSEALSSLYLAGAEIAWEAFDKDYPRRKVALPTYPFQRERYWFEPQQTAPNVREHPLPEWLSEHRVDGVATVPAAAYLAAAPGGAAANLTIARMKTVRAGEPLRVVDGESIRFLIGGELCATASAAQPTASSSTPDWKECATPLDVDAFYATLAANGLDYGSHFRGITELRTGGNAAVARLAAGLHPIARIDCALQTIAAALTTSSHPPGFRPVSIASFALHEHDGELLVHAALRADGSDLVADVTIAAGDRVIGRIGGVTLRRSALDQAFYRLEWQDAPLATCVSIAASVTAATPRDEELSSALDRVAAAFAKQAVDAVDADVVTRTRLYARLRELAANESSDAAGECQRLLETYPAHGAAIALLARGGASLSAVLRGEVDPLDVLFPAADRATASVYGESPASRAIHTAAADAFRTIASGGRKLRVLEIGAGTGATTRALLPQIASGGHRYCFTDISPQFVHAARREFGEALDYATLDIERDPAEQQLDAHSFDVVVAANVLHATADLRETLANVRRLLASGGHLILIESDPRDRWLDLTFGLTDGWWRFRDTDLRSHPLLRSEEWLTLLRTCGFDDASAVESCGVVIGRAARDPQRWLVLGDEADSLAAALRERGQTSEAGDETRIAEHDAVVAVGYDCFRALDLAQRVIAAATHPRLVFVSRDAQRVLDSDRADPDGGALWGMARSLAIEHPELRCTRIDADDLDSVADALLAFDGEDQIALRNGRRFVARLRPAPVAPRRELAIDSEATYLITGGLRGLGLLFARHLVDRGARHLLLIGRRIDAESDKAIAGLRARGIDVVVELADAGDRARMQSLLDAARRAMPPLRGVIHAAGVLEDGVVAQLDRERFERVLRPKADGARNLDELTRGDALDFFVLFSSAVSLLGSAGQANHAAANAFLDALAERRRSESLPALSISWGAWSEAGTVARLGAIDALERQGTRRITTAFGLAAFDRLLRSDLAHVAVMPLDTSRVEQTASAKPVLRELVAEESTTATQSLAARLASLARREALQLLRTELRAMAAHVLGLKQVDGLSSAQPLTELGLDSLMAVELRNTLAAALARPLPATLLFDHPTIDDLLLFLGGDLADSAPVAIETTATADEPIAVIGIGCRFPGGANDADSFWRFLRAGGDSIAPVPRERWNSDEFYDPTPGTAGRMYVARAGFLDAIDGFDPEFFRVSPREAVTMDPQQRLLLEVTWEALEHAGHSAQKLMRSDTGVFIGICSNEYSQLASGGDAARVDAYSGSGGAYSVAAGRLSYFFGFEGPSIAVDTACSSSLVTVHLAAQSLRSGECGIAVAGGVNLMISPLTTVALCAAKMLAPDGRCKTFDASADGFVRGEGCGVVVLKRLSDATRDGDRVLAVIRGTAVNQDGRSAGLTAPNGPSQEAVIRRALRNARVDPARVGYVEAHGTGTSLGDPIELQSLAGALGGARTKPLYVGSVKTNIGHLEAAAGVAGLIKTVLALQHREIPPHLHFERLNPNVALNGFPIEVASRSATPWSSEDGETRIAGVSSFSFSGTNAHVILEEAPAPVIETAPDRPLHLLALSARDAASLRDLIDRYVALLAADDDASLADICATALSGRAHFAHRVAVVAATKAEAIARLKNATASVVDEERIPAVMFVFDDVTPFDAASVRELRETQPTFRRLLDGRDPEDAIAVQSALASLYHAWGIEPSSAGDGIAMYIDATNTQWSRILDTLAALYRSGVAVDWRAFDSDYTRRKQTLPTYPFQRARYWVDPPIAPEPPIALRRIAIPFTADAHFETLITPASCSDHRIDGRAVMPAAAFLSIIVMALRELTGNAEVTLEDIVFAQPLEVDADIPLHVVFTPALDFRVASRRGEEFTVHVEGRGRRGGPTPETHALVALRERFDGTPQPMPELPAALELGPRFRCIGEAWRGDGEALASIESTGDPGLIDSLFQLIAAGNVGNGALELPFAIATLHVRGDLAAARWAYATTSTAAAMNDGGDVLVEITGFRSRPAPRGAELHEWSWIAGEPVAGEQALVLRGTPEQIAVNALHAAQDAVRTNTRLTFADAPVLRGFAATVALEHPELDCKVVDATGARLRPQVTRAQDRKEGRLVTAGGVLENLTFAPPLRHAPSAGEVEIHVRASGLNFRDVLNAMGLYPGDAGPLGGECAGVVTAVGAGVTNVAVGDEVVALAAGAFATHVVAPAQLVVRKPPHRSFEDAAAMPVAFLTAAHAIENVARLRRGQRILIHAATGGVGLAAVQLAQRIGADVFATAGTPEKRQLLQSLGIEHVRSSRDSYFARHFRGMDVVLNSLSGEMLSESLKLVAPGGCFLEIGKIGIRTHAEVAALRPDIRYEIIELAQSVAAEPERLGQLLERIVHEAAPLPKTVFDLGAAVDAFRYMQQAKHVGKIVLANPDAVAISADGTYLVTGGTRGIGFEIARHLADRGAQHVVIVGRRAPETADARLTFLQADVANREELARVIDTVHRLHPPLRGIVHAAGVIDDGILTQQTAERFARVLAPKISGARHLDELTANDPLDFFVLFSSLAGVFGSPGQSAYAAANSWLDAFAAERRASGRPATSIAWSAWAKTGMAAGNARVGDRISIDEGLAMFDRALRSGAANLAVMPRQRRAATATTTTAPQPQLTIKRPLIERLRDAVAADRHRMLTGEIIALAVRVLAIDDARLTDLRRPLNALGLDSLMAVELRNALSAALEQPLPATLLFDHPSIEALAAFIETNVTPELFARDGANEWDEVDRMSEEEAERSLLAELDQAGY